MGEHNLVPWAAPDYQGVATRLVLPDYYDVGDWLGSGTGGIVCRARDTRTGQEVALKSVIGHLTNPRGVIKVIREIRVLRHLAACEPIVKLHGAFRCGDWNAPRGPTVCMVMELMQTDLESVIRSGQVNEDNVAWFAYQLILGLKYMHQCGIIHRDLKPSNVLVNEDCGLKIADFGSARDHAEADTIYVVTRWYRAPELLMSVKYDTKVDLFAVGCILGQMLKSMALGSPDVKTGRDPTVLFPGAHYIEQMRMILSLGGVPSAEDVQAIPSPAAREYILKMVPTIQPGSPTFGTAFPGIPSPPLELLQWLLQFNPAKRCTADQALHHPWLGDYLDVEQAALTLPEYDHAYERLKGLTEVLAELDKELVVYTAPILPDAPSPDHPSTNAVPGSDKCRVVTVQTPKEPPAAGSPKQLTPKAGYGRAGSKDHPTEKAGGRPTEEAAVTPETRSNGGEEDAHAPRR
jgi:serine/threonine protein kinase